MAAAAGAGAVTATADASQTQSNAMATRRDTEQGNAGHTRRGKAREGILGLGLGSRGSQIESNRGEVGGVQHSNAGGQGSDGLGFMCGSGMMIQDGQSALRCDGYHSIESEDEDDGE